MRHIYFLACGIVLVFVHGLAAADPTNVDNSKIAEASKPLAHLSNVFAFAGRPLNLDEDRPVTVLVNHGYILGFSPSRKQPVWAAYRVSGARQSTNYTRPPLFYKDTRLPESDRISTRTFGGGYDRGHMVPNFAINTMYGKLGQLETFFMSNVCPQKAGLNRGAWQRLEHDIVTDFAPAWDHIWVLCGPIFGSNPEQIRGIDVPTHFYMILVDVHGRSNTPDVLALKLPQTLSQGQRVSQDHIQSVDAIEALTKLNIFPQFRQGRQTNHETDPAESLWAVEDVDE